jgi:hypothetical protein
LEAVRRRVMSDTRSGVERIADERLRQIMTEGYSAEHDDGHIHGELAMAAACYAAPERLYEMREAFCSTRRTTKDSRRIEELLRKLASGSSRRRALLLQPR